MDVAGRSYGTSVATVKRGPHAVQLVKADTPFARNLALSHDAEQRFLYVGNGNDIVIIERRGLRIVGSIKPAGLRNGGHQIATDSKGNLYVAQTTNGMQKLTFMGMR